MSVIAIDHLTKIFRVPQQREGLWNAVRGVFRREYRERTALQAVSAQIEAGEMVGLVGANGAGKTTLMKLLTGIIHPTCGSARVLGYTPHERAIPFRQQIALVMGQKAQLWWDLPASDGLALLRAMYRIPPPVYRERLDALTTQLGVTHLMSTPLRRLSLGERMKMELIAALLHAPKVVFLDEPTIGLDFTSQRTIRQFLRDYRRTHQATMLITSHYMEDIEQLCERLLIIRDGHLVYDGALAALNHHTLELVDVIEAVMRGNETPERILQSMLASV